MAKKFIITGCGRSGTGYMAEKLNAAGLKCGHESVFRVDGSVKWYDYDCDSSWFAAPHIKNLPKDILIIHIVRNPIFVAKSFHRIGLFSFLSWRNFIINPSISFVVKKYLLRPKNIFYRLKHVILHRKMLSKNGSSLSQSGEMNRFWKYWLEWNIMIENGVRESGASYLLIRLEDIDIKWESLCDHIGITLENVKINKINEKRDYHRKEIEIKHIPSDVRELAYKYGYEL